MKRAGANYQKKKRGREGALYPQGFVLNKGDPATASELHGNYQSLDLPDNRQ